jgi:hypothetical protein
MSRAFVKEEKNDTVELPDRPISPHRNLVTESGFAAIEAALARFVATQRAATGEGDRRPPPPPRGKSDTGRQGARARKLSNPPLTEAGHPSARSSPFAGMTVASRASGSSVKMRPIPREAPSHTCRLWLEPF